MPNYSTPVNFRDRTGERYGRLVVIGRADNAGGRTTWLCRCDCGGEKVVRGESLHAGLTQSCGCLRRERLAAGFKPRDPNPSYLAVHKRIARERGPAIEHDCVDCGEQAAHWSYDGQDPDERVGPVAVRGRTYQVTFSVNHHHYAPRCAGCHKKHDTRS